MTKQAPVTLARFDRSLDAELARSVLEGEGIDCRLCGERNSEESPIELQVRPEDVTAAKALLQAGEPLERGDRGRFAACPACGGRTVVWQGKVFWIILALTLIVMVPLASLFSLKTALMVGSGAALFLAGTELSLKDWRCARCGHRWRERSQ